MFAALLDLAKKSECNDSLEVVVADWFIFIRITSLGCAEYAQKTQSPVDEHEYPSGKHITKAFLPTDWKFYNKSGVTINTHPFYGDVQVFPTKLHVTFRIQKNRQNGQSITLVVGKIHPDICPVQAAYRIFLGAKRLGQLDSSQPMAVFVNKNNATKCLTGNKKLQRIYVQLQRRSIQTSPKKSSRNSPPTRVEYGPLCYLTKQG